MAESPTDFISRNRNLLLLRHISAQDYVACRLCFFHGFLSQGYVLAAQAIEKELKSIICYLEPSIDFKKTRYLHKIPKLIDKINTHGINLLALRSYCEKLSQYYELERYPDNNIKLKQRFLSSDEINQIDDTMFKIMDLQPLPEKYMFGGGVYNFILDKSNKNTNQYKWLRYNNLAFEYRKIKLEKKFKLYIH